MDPIFLKFFKKRDFFQCVQMCSLCIPLTFKAAPCPEVWSHGSSSSSPLVSFSWGLQLWTQFLPANKIQQKSLEKTSHRYCAFREPHANRLIIRPHCCASSFVWNTKAKQTKRRCHYEKVCDTFLRVYLVLLAVKINSKASPEHVGNELRQRCK